ncbi:hypothetical protein N7517_010800 [Penicillium concentricum]|uniref:Uncharacterized protein n=1 Tax=Penicillium concentricum TaxID=293559 RepID=A0A9W9R9S1_9EURO|nr:uncharacterized protein N7517_010800 [Penicillium concentricum]KAJ5356191.1 hypothetical protein N7517_010800 [Penicillium concentricum]
MRGILQWKERDGARPATATVAGIDCHGEESTSASDAFEPIGTYHLFPSDVMTKQICIYPEIPKPYIFGRLSLELKFEIFSYLTFDGPNSICSHGRIGEAWFLLGQEADFLFLNVTDRKDWYLLFFGTRASLVAYTMLTVKWEKIRGQNFFGIRETLIKQTLSLINRKKIRQLLEPIATIVSLEPVLRNGPYGSAGHPRKEKANIIS